MDHHPNLQRYLICVVLSVLFTMNLYGQDTLKHFTFDVGAGFSFPSGQLANHTKTGFNFAASAGPRLNSSFSIDLDFSLHSFNVEDSLHSTVNDVDFSRGSVVRLWSLSVNPTYQFLKRERFSGYATA